MAWVFSGFSNVYYFACVQPTALKCSCITNFVVLFLKMRFISLVDEIQFMLISSHHMCIKSDILTLSFLSDTFESVVCVVCESTGQLEYRDANAKSGKLSKWTRIESEEYQLETDRRLRFSNRNEKRNGLETGLDR